MGVAVTVGVVGVFRFFQIVVGWHPPIVFRFVLQVFSTHFAFLKSLRMVVTNGLHLYSFLDAAEPGSYFTEGLRVHWYHSLVSIR